MVRRLVRVATALFLSIGALCATAQTVTRPFSVLRPTGGAAAAAHALIVELSPREALSGVHLHLVSNVVPSVEARYVVWVNGALATQVDVQGAEQTIALSPQAFLPGINSVQLARVPRSTAISAETALSDVAPDDDARSTVSLEFAGMRPNPAPTLAQLSVAFDRRAWMSRTVTVEFGHDPPTPGQLRAAAVTVQGIAARMREVNVSVADQRSGAIFQRHDPASWGIDGEAARMGDVLLVGTRKALADALPASVARAINGPFLGVYPADEGKSVVVVVSGITDADCIRAAQAFADTAMVLPARSTLALDAATVVHAPQSHLVLSLEQANAALVRAALNFAAINYRVTGELADVTFTISGGNATADVFLGRVAALDTRRLRQLPVFPPLLPGQVVSLPDSSGKQRFVAVLGSGYASVARAVEMLREPAVWSLFTRGATLYDTRAESAVPLAVARRSLVADLRLRLADPATFWGALAVLLALSYVFLNIALKAQVARRLHVDNPSSLSGTPPER